MVEAVRQTSIGNRLKLIETSANGNSSTYERSDIPATNVAFYITISGTATVQLQHTHDATTWQSLGAAQTATTTLETSFPWAAMRVNVSGVAATPTVIVWACW